VGQIYFFTLHSTNPAYDAMELKSLEDWVVEKSFKSVPDIVDVSSLAVPRASTRFASTRQTGGVWLSLAQVEQQLTNNNVMRAAASSRKVCSRSTYVRWDWSTGARTSNAR